MEHQKTGRAQKMREVNDDNDIDYERLQASRGDSFLATTKDVACPV